MTREAFATVYLIISLEAKGMQIENKNLVKIDIINLG